MRATPGRRSAREHWFRAMTRDSARRVSKPGSLSPHGVLPNTHDALKWHRSAKGPLMNVLCAGRIAFLRRSAWLSPSPSQRERAASGGDQARSHRPRSRSQAVWSEAACVLHAELSGEADSRAEPLASGANTQSTTFQVSKRFGAKRHKSMPNMSDPESDIGSPLRCACSLSADCLPCRRWCARPSGCGRAPVR